MKDKKNCFNCKFCEYIERSGTYNCVYKHCKMGKEPYYPKSIPKNQLMAFGIKLCNFTPI